MLSNDLSVQLYQSVADDNAPRVYKHWHASSLADCPRSHYFKRLGLPALNTPTAAKMLRWQTGHLMEQVIRPHVAKVWGNGEVVDSNQRFTSKQWDLTGEFDNHLATKTTLIEVKTVHDYALIERNGVTTLKQATGRLNKWNRPEYEPMLTPYLHHEIQNHGYVLLMKEHNLPVTNIDYAYLSLSGRLVVYTTQVNPELLERVKARLELLNKAWKDQVPPECLCKPEAKLWGGVYQWCDYRVEGGECCSLQYYKEWKKSQDSITPEVIEAADKAFGSKT